LRCNPTSQSQSDKPRTVFYVSDGTGITAEGFGHSLLAQFEKLAIREIRLPFIDSLPKAREALEKINRSSAAEAARPLVFSTLVNPEIALPRFYARPMHSSSIFLQVLWNRLSKNSA